MRLVERHDARREQHQEIFRQCVGDHDERKAYHADLRSLYTLGSSDGSKAPYNKLTAHVRQSARDIVWIVVTATRNQDANRRIPGVVRVTVRSDILPTLAGRID